VPRLPKNTFNFIHGIYEFDSHMRYIIDSRQLRTFLTLASSGSFTAAARELRITQSAVSHSIRALENDVGCKLIDRLGKKVTPTQAGEQLLTSAERILSEMEAARTGLTQLGDWGSGRIRVAAALTACVHVLPGAIREFRESFPRANIYIDPMDTPAAISALRERQVDIALGLEPEAATDISFKRHVTDELWFVVPPSHPWASLGFAPVEDIAKQHYILYGKRSTTAGIITRYFASMGVTLRSSIELANIEAIIELVAIGMGVSVLTDWVVANALRKKIVCKVPLGKRKLHRRWGVSLLRRKRLSLAEETFVGLCKASFESVFERTARP
jgi:DNA-binding transcriptional LysR family regulator